MYKLAPIALFVYNRPIHTQKVLNSLASNSEAANSELFIFSDGPKENNTKKNNNIGQVREIIASETRFKKVHIIESEFNIGLSKSVINGVTYALSFFDSLIILEDDVLVAKGFLKYMNEALSLYIDNSQVGCIHAWNYNLNLNGQNEETFFLRGADCWGWATWKRAWDLFEPNGEYLLEKIKSNNLEYSFNRNGTHSFTKMLEDQINGKNDSWAIRWHASLFLNNMFCLQPVQPIVKNIGLDGSGIHAGSTPIEQIPVDFINVNRIEIKESDWFFKEYNTISRGGARLSIWQLLKSWAKKYYLHS